jgi:hypothetical protein
MHINIKYCIRNCIDAYFNFIENVIFEMYVSNTKCQLVLTQSFNDFDCHIQPFLSYTKLMSILEFVFIHKYLTEAYFNID